MADYRQSWFFYRISSAWMGLPMTFYGGYYHNPVQYGFLDAPTSYTLDDLGFLRTGGIHEWTYQKNSIPIFLRRDNCDNFTDGEVENYWTITNNGGSGIYETNSPVVATWPAWFYIAGSYGGGMRRQDAVGHDPMSTGHMWVDTFTHGEMIRNLNNNDTEFWVAARLCPRGGPTATTGTIGAWSIFNSDDYYTSGLFLFPDHDGGWGVNKRYNRIEIGLTYDSSIGGSNVGIWFAASAWDPDAGDDIRDHNVEEVLDTTDGPVEVMIQRRNISGITADWYVYYRIHGSVGGPNDWGAWQEADDAGVKAVIAAWGTAWTDPGRLDQSVTCYCGTYAYTQNAGLDNERAFFGRFQYGLNPSDPASNQLYLEDHLASEEIEFKEVLTGTPYAYWDMSTFDHTITNTLVTNVFGIEGSAKNDLVQFAYDIDNDNTPSYSAYKTLAQMQAEPDKHGKYFHLKAKLIDGAGAPTPYGGVVFPGSSDNEGEYSFFDYDASTTPEFGITTCVFKYGPDFTFEGSPTSGGPPLSVNFWPIIESSATVVSSWDFGDPDSGTLNYSMETTPTHVYNDYGVYSVALTCENPYTWTTVTRSDYITVIEPQITYAVDFEGSPTSGYTPLNVQFYETGSNKMAKAWSWDFGDGQTSANANPFHLYSEAGVYTVAMTGTSVDDDSDTETKVNYITVIDEGSPGPQPNFYYESSPIDSRGGIAPYHVHFYDASSNNPDTWSWDFDGDGVEDSTLQNPSYTYDSAGTYSVTLGVSRDGGSVNSFTWGNLINVESSWAPSVSDSYEYGFKIWHLPSASRYLEGGRHLISDNAVKHFSCSYLARGGLGGARLVLAKEWTNRASEAIEIGDPIALMKKNSSAYSEEAGYIQVWYYGYVSEISSDAGSDEVTYILEGPMGRLAGIYPGGNSDDDKTIFYKTHIYNIYTENPNDPRLLESSFVIDKNNIEDIVKDLYDRYLATLTFSENPNDLVYGARGVTPRFYSEATAATTNIFSLRLDGEQSLCEIMDQLCILAGDYVWGVDVRCHYGGSPESIVYVEPVFFFRKRSRDAGYPATASFAFGDRSYPLTSITETESRRYLYNELALEGGYMYGGLPYVVPYARVWRHAGSIAKYGKRRISMCFPMAKTYTQAEQYINEFFSKYSFPHKFYSVTQIGSTERIQPWRMEYYINGDGDWTPEGGHIMLKNESGGVVGVYEFDESTLNILGPTSVWTVELGPRNPKLKSGISTLTTSGLGGSLHIGPDVSTQARKTQEAITQDDYDTPYKPVYLGYAQVLSGDYDADLKDYLYTIMPIQDPTGIIGVEPERMGESISGVLNIQSVLIMPSVAGHGNLSYSARKIVPGTIVNYYRGWNPIKRSSYYYIAEQGQRLVAYSINPVNKGVVSTFTVTADIPPESAFYNGLRYDHVAPTVQTFIQGGEKEDWTVWASWTMDDNPKLHVHGRTVDNLPRSTASLTVDLWFLGNIEKRSDWGFAWPIL